MNYYAEIALEYFKKTEGWHLYPKWPHWNLFTSLALFIAFASSMAYGYIHGVTDESPATLNRYMWLGLVFELLWLWSCSKISDYKKDELIAQTNRAHKKNFSRIEDCHSFIMTDLLKKERFQFINVAKEIKELIDMGKMFRRASDPGVDFFVRKIYDPDAKQRYWAGFIAFFALLSAVIVRSGLPDFSIFEAITDTSFWLLVALFAFVAIALFLLIIGLNFCGLMIYDILTTLVLRSQRHAKGSKAALSYLVRHLIIYHIPAEAATNQFRDEVAMPSSSRIRAIFGKLKGRFSKPARVATVEEQATV